MSKLALRNLCRRKSGSHFARFTYGEITKWRRRQSNTWVRIVDAGSGEFIAFGVTI